MNNGVYGQPVPISSRFRHNPYRTVRQNIDRDNSEFGIIYKSVEKRLKQTEIPRFTLPPEAILKSVTHALECQRARVRYRVTSPTKIMSVLKRILPDRMMDALLEVNSDQHK
ncbi:MAG: hypothetical protein WBM41_03855 [Arenicellales bacterium]